jgi:hypothetical protein
VSASEPLRLMEAGTYTVDGEEVHRVILEGGKDAVRQAARLLYQQARVQKKEPNDRRA